MKRTVISLAIALIFTGLLAAAPISLAQNVPEGGKWAKKAEMPTPRAYFSTTVVNNLIYAIGGWSGIGPAPTCCNIPLESLSTVEAYDPATNTWIKKADIPTKRLWHSTSVVDGKIYAFGGQSLVERRGKQIAKTVTAIEVYDPAADAWEKVGDAPLGRIRMSSAALNGKIYVIGGSQSGLDKRTLVEVFDPAQNTWAEVAELNERRTELTASVVSGKVYAIGGWRKDDIWMKTVEEYDPGADVWQNKAEMPTGRDQLSVSTPAVNGKIYVIGGRNPQNHPLKIVEEFDPAKNEWTKMNSMPTGRRGLSVSAVRGKVYAIGGLELEGGTGGKAVLGGFMLGTVEEYTPAGWPFSVSPQGKLSTIWGAIKAAN